MPAWPHAWPHARLHTKPCRRGGRYHFSLGRDVTSALASRLSLPADYVRLTLGASEALVRSAQILTSASSLVIADPTFDACAGIAEARGAAVHRIPLRHDGSHDVAAMASADHHAGLIYVCNPNNPSGTLTAYQDIRWLLDNKPESTTLLVDEAYIEYTEIYGPALTRQCA